MRIAVVGLGLIGGSMALALRATHDVSGFDADASTREAARGRGLAVVDRSDDLFRARPELIVVATPAADVVATLERLAALAGGATLIEVASLKREVAAYAERAPGDARIVGVHPMAGSTASGFAAADPAIFRARPFLVVPTARSDRPAMALAAEVGRELGGEVTVCSAEWHDRAVAMLSGVPLAVAIALARAGEDVAHLAGPGFDGATRLAATPPDLARSILGGAEVKDALRRFRAALDDVERGI